MLNTLKLKLICWLRSHDWKRAVRHTAVSGTQACRRCSARRPVLLRMPAAARKSGDVPLEYPKTIFTTQPAPELPASQWPVIATSPLTPPVGGV